MACRITLVECANPLNERLHSPLLKDDHQGRCEGLSCIRWHLGDCCFWSCSLLNVAACNLLELEVSCDISRNEDVGELSARHQKLGNQVDVPVVGATVLLPWLLSLVVVSVLLEELECVRYGSLESYIYSALTVSMLTDAASLSSVSQAVKIQESGCHNIPSVVVVAVNMQNLLALHTENTTAKSIRRSW